MRLSANRLFCPPLSSLRDSFHTLPNATRTSSPAQQQGGQVAVGRHRAASWGHPQMRSQHGSQLGSSSSTPAAARQLAQQTAQHGSSSGQHSTAAAARQPAQQPDSTAGIQAGSQAGSHAWRAPSRKEHPPGCCAVLLCAHPPGRSTPLAAPGAPWSRAAGSRRWTRSRRPPCARSSPEPRASSRPTQQ